jgi:VCBS repeat-containing protein
MGEQKSAVVVAFEKQQGFGRVAVDGAGELPFDATVSRAKVEELVVGAKVEIEIGPSRIRPTFPIPRRDRRRAS